MGTGLTPNPRPDLHLTVGEHDRGERLEVRDAGGELRVETRR
jgi:hypothetical protein